MANIVKDAQTALVHLNAMDLMYPLICLSEAAQLDSPGKLRDEINWWFEAAFTHAESDYDLPETRILAFKLHKSVLRLIEIAYYLHNLENEEKKLKLLASFR